jgi:hypothetical protein
MRFGWESGKREFLTLLLLMKCQDCGVEKNEKQLFSYVDGNNGAITRNSKNYCLKCYAKHHGTKDFTPNQLIQIGLNISGT